jgi:hypothetical protein
MGGLAERVSTDEHVVAAKPRSCSSRDDLAVEPVPHKLPGTVTEREWGCYEQSQLAAPTLMASR